MKRPKRNAMIVLLSAANEPPTEFRIFAAGWNETSKGRFLFDEKSAADVMAAYKRDGIDRMIDLEHLSLDSDANNYDSAAYGWYNLELRDGELWAINVKWTDDGASRLRARKSRYLSPAFHYDGETLRVTELYNVAICAIPATYDAPALIAASKRCGKNIGALSYEVDTMDLLKKLIAALGLAEDATAEDVLKAVAALQESGGGDGDSENADDDAPADDTETNTDEPKKDEEKLSRLLAKHPMLLARVLAAKTSSTVLASRLEKLEKRTATSEVESLMAANADKIPKSLEGWARAQKPEHLREYLKHATPVAKDPAKEPGADTRVEEVTLTAADREVAAHTGQDLAKVLEHKKKLAAKKLSRVG